MHSPPTARKILLSGLAIMLLTVACGNSGPLYLPDEEAPPRQASEDDEGEEDQDREYAD